MMDVLSDLVHPMRTSRRVKSDELFPREDIVKLVNERWKSYSVYINGCTNRARA
ncbi:hypothetical protein [Paenibacillus aceti]|uniref:hypothetical protein n=1 Tax=Paenibacillus aceti TaxID=1820010 RepID=UPI001E2F9343|nr:hypothetical protein [Paenibacillus aceti]